MRTHQGVLDFSLTPPSRIDTHANSSTWDGHQKRVREPSGTASPCQLARRHQDESCCIEGWSVCGALLL
jgi:hypothetical protein